MKILSTAVELWPRILAQQEELAAHPFLPLHNLCDAEATAGLTALRTDIWSPILSRQVPVIGKLAELTVDDLLELRKALYVGAEQTAVRNLAEKLLKNAEIKFPNTGSLHPTLREPKFAALLLSSFFLDFWIQSGDARFLNSSWKLLDYLSSRGPGTGPGLSKEAAQALCCRNILLAVQGLQKP